MIEKLKKALNSAILPFVGYFNEQAFVLNGDRVISNPKVSSKAIWIVGRKHYREWVKHYPMNEKKLVKRALSLDSADSDAHSIVKSSSGGFDVIFWSFAFEKLPKGNCFIPESLLVGKQLSSNQAVSLSTPGGEVFVAKQNELIRSAKKTALMATVEQFSTSVGLSVTASSEKLNIADVIHSGLLSVLPNIPEMFVSDSSQRQPLWRLAIPLAVVAGMYLIGSSAYLSWRLDSVKAAYAERSDELSQALSRQDKVQQLQRKVDVYEQISDTTSSSFYIWKILKPLFQQPDVSFRRITFDDGAFEVFGSAERATDVLRTLTEIEGVSAAFNRPVTKRRAEEIFSIELKYSPRATESVDE